MNPPTPFLFASADLPEGTVKWRNYACMVEPNPNVGGGFCVHIYTLEQDGESWVHNQLGCATLRELSTQLAAALEEVHRRGIEAGKAQVRAALGLANVRR